MEAKSIFYCENKKEYFFALILIIIDPKQKLKFKAIVSYSRRQTRSFVFGSYKWAWVGSQDRGKKQPIVGVEPTTFYLQGKCSTTKLYRQQWLSQALQF